MPSAPRFPAPGTLAAKLTVNAIKLNTVAYRATGGRIGGTMPGGMAPVLLLDHVGRKSGQKRTAPLIYVRDGDNLAIIASRGGSDAPPAWWLNLRANPTTTVQVKRDRWTVAAREATPEEHERIWPQAVAVWPDYDVYQSRTDRRIPVVILEPA
jgi:deazaflavin-dependent oxidoreductase (nitroreductase family)